MTSATTLQQDLYAEVTAQILASLETGTSAPSLPWHCADWLPQNAATGRSYRGVNVLLLWAARDAHGYSSSRWATYRQWLAMGGQVRAGQRATSIVFWKDRRPGGDDATTPAADDAKAPRFVARSFAVFNAEQVEGLAVSVPTPLYEGARNERAEAFFAGLPLQVRHGGQMACYVPSVDEIRLPPFCQFKDAAGFYAVFAHEAVHATGAKHRLDRNLSGRFGTAAYAAEELVAELGAAFVCAELGLSAEPRPDHASYIASWLTLCRDDPRAIFTAASHAQAAADWLAKAAESADASLFHSPSSSPAEHMVGRFPRSREAPE